MSTVAQQLYNALTHRYTVIIAVVLFTIYLIQSQSAEEYADFDLLGNVVKLPSGVYSLRNVYGPVSNQLLSGIPQLDTNNVTHGGGDVYSRFWAFKKVTDGVYLIRKPLEESRGAQCLYSSNDQQVKGYIVRDPKICGMETLNDQNQLDPYSIRLYFKLSSAPNGTVVIQSLQNNMYLSYDGYKLQLLSSPDERSYFKVESV